MRSNGVPRPSDFRDELEELTNALQAVVLLAAGLERVLCDTHWAPEAADLRRAAERAAHAAGRLRTHLHQTRTYSR